MNVEKSKILILKCDLSDAIQLLQHQEEEKKDRNLGGPNKQAN